MGEKTDVKRRPTRLPGISSRAWEHPADRGALTALRKLQGFDTLMRSISGLVNERMVKMMFLGSAIRVGDQQYPRIYRIYAEAASVLDVVDLPELYVVADPTINAMCLGMDKPLIVVNSGLVDVMDDDELRFVLGHELGHMLTGHAVYRTVAGVLVTLSQMVSAIPIGGLGVRVIQTALQEWQRKSELSADRAGLLATQQPQAAIRTHMKLASGGSIDELDIAAFLAQAKEYRDTESLRDSVLKLMLLDAASHPFAVMRAAELQSWVTSGEYATIISGDYPKRSDDDSAELTADAKAAAASYAAAFAESNDALTKLLGDVGAKVGAIRDWVFGRRPSGEGN